MGRAETSEKRGGRYPRGFGLPSLVVVLFLVSVLVSAIVEQFARDTVEGRASAAFNTVEDRFHAFDMTAGDGAGLLPHLVPSRDVMFDIVAGATGLAPAVLVTPDFRSGREGALFDQKLRAFLNVPASEPIGPVSRGQARRQHPERVLRAGDRMGTSIDLWDVPASAASVVSAGEIRSGTAGAARAASAGLLIGPQGSLLETPQLTAVRVLSDGFEVTGNASGGTGSVTGALVARFVLADTLEVTGLLRGREAVTPSTRVMGNFATDSLDNQDQIFFNEVVVSGVRAGEALANRLTFGTRVGPAPGPLSGDIPRVDPSNLFEGRQ
jgi:hypothetical protein